MSWQINMQKWVTTGLIGKKYFQKTKERYSKEKAAQYYAQNNEAIKKKVKRALWKLATRKKRQN